MLLSVLIICLQILLNFLCRQSLMVYEVYYLLLLKEVNYHVKTCFQKTHHNMGNIFHVSLSAKRTGQLYRTWFYFPFSGSRRKHLAKGSSVG